MGGETIIPPTSTSEEEYSVDQDFPLPSLSSLNPTLLRDYLRMKAEDGKNESDRLFLEEFDKMGPQSSSPDFEAYHKRRQKVYKEVLQSYDQLRVRSKSLNEAKYKVLSYFPGTWFDNVGGKKLSDYDVPKTTSLLLIGPKGCGKSSLVNKISRVFEDDNFAPERAQISYNPSVGDGTYYLQGYMIPRGSASFCLYDSRGLADGTSENINMVQYWMNNGVRHGEPVIRKSDDSSLRRRMKFKPRELGWKFCRPQMVNFVIFVVDAVSVLKSIEGDGVEDLLCLQMISEVFKHPCLSFKDDKPVVAITHGDLLSIADRVRARVYLGELLGIPPAKQIFDIPVCRKP
ncbi:hypothetical protein ERO13_D11G146600v2 [Gossypium hirsutum]|uniref:G domain-containing protein n=2 Tax=Gossypium TaxID=3633 RepID=A0A5D2SRU1_GOSMU|nr:hypothetical protein ERO13_D11G146600v2 [Gossypium hirsutum]TYH43936.1 hypothetical protein ES332_D11G159400v1 [Gossypium tomentosum]TYI55669.1 hypothetical protein E1A91_D11G156900v1 [Gossypium mustelinum]